jgi:hypothetical protein
MRARAHSDSCGSLHAGRLDTHRAPTYQREHSQRHARLECGVVTVQARHRTARTPTRHVCDTAPQPHALLIVITHVRQCAIARAPCSASTYSGSQCVNASQRAFSRTLSSLCTCVIGDHARTHTRTHSAPERSHRQYVQSRRQRSYSAVGCSLDGDAEPEHILVDGGARVETYEL